jgi:hypothetical protein
MAFAQAGYPMKAGETINGFVFRLMASPDSTQTVQQILDGFYASPYFKGTGLKPVKRIGF